MAKVKNVKLINGTMYVIKNNKLVIIGEIRW